MMDAGTASVPRKTTVRRLKRKGNAVAKSEEVRALPLKACDEAFPRGKRFVYMGGSGVQGSLAGVACTVGDIEVLIGGTAGGVGAAPGATQVVTAIAADIAGVLFAGSRLVHPWRARRPPSGPRS